MSQDQKYENKGFSYWDSDNIKESRNKTYDDGICYYIGDTNSDDTWDIMDIVNITNCVLAQNCADQENPVAYDCDQDSTWTILDIVNLINCVLLQSCAQELN